MLVWFEHLQYLVLDGRLHPPEAGERSVSFCWVAGFTDESLHYLGERGFRFDRFLTQQVSESDIEIKQPQRRILVRFETFEKFLDLGGQHPYNPTRRTRPPPH